MKTIRQLSQSISALSTVLALMLATAVLGQEPVVYGRVVGVTDGDTIKVLVAEKQLLRIRLAFCDAPEKKQAFGARAKQAMSELVFGKDIELRTHAIDRYGRTVAQVDVDGKDVGAEMVRQGLAWVYDRYITEASTEIQDTYRKAQEEAKAERLGLWSDPNAIPPWIFSQGSSGTSNRLELDQSTPEVRRSEYVLSAACCN